MARKLQRPWGAGSIYWSEKFRRWEGALRVGYSHDGKPQRQKFYGATGDDSAGTRDALAKRMDAFANAGPKGKRAVSTLAQAIEKYVESGDDLRTSTRYWYNNLYENHVKGSRIARKLLTAIPRAEVFTFLRGLDVGTPTRRAVHALLRRVFQVAILEDHVTVNPVAGIKKPKATKPQIRAWTPDETLAFLGTKAARGHPFYALILLSLTTSMGPAELFGLQKRSLDLKAGYLIVEHNLVEVGGKIYLEEPKTEYRRRRLDLPKITIDALRAYLKAQLSAGNSASPYVFTTTTGKPIRRSTFNRRQWASLMKSAAEELVADARRRKRHYNFVPITMYGMRHTANALMSHLDVPLEVAKERMGHAEISQTSDTYGHLQAGAQRAVASKLETFLRG
ncbi:MAG: site-specific integrase [Candidatus Eremiobacteraeota bacterium]|nr:site-specific integrase [Candidatus Eremiobacteraeota bacterium]